MRILIAHNRYQNIGGEDVVFHNEVELLRTKGHDVIEFIEDNCRIAEVGWLKLGADTIWNRSSYDRLDSVLREFQPQIAHFHNTFPLISPSAYFACNSAGVPVVQTLHNYRLVCPQTLFYRSGKTCEDCLGRKVKWPAVVHSCYRNKAATTALTAMLALHGWLHTWTKRVTQYLALSEFSRQKFIEGGLPADKIAVKPNFPSFEAPQRCYAGKYALFVGRLSAEKGADLLLQAWTRNRLAVPLHLVGDGPLLDKLRRTAEGETQIVFDGWLNQDALEGLMRDARFLVFPSRTYENFPLTLVEAFACGLPVITSRLGASAEIVEDGCTGLHFAPDDAGDLAAKVQWAWTHLDEMERMGRNARSIYESKYTPEKSYEMLMQIYGNILYSETSLTTKTAGQ